jgi:hypothetical protein
MPPFANAEFKMPKAECNQGELNRLKRVHRGKDMHGCVKTAM